MWGRPVVRGELPLAGLEALLARTTCTFEDETGRWDTVGAWLMHLRQSGALPEARPGIELQTIRGDTADFLVSTESPVKTPDGVHFGVHFCKKGSGPPPTHIDVAGATRALDGALDALVALGGRADLESWTGNFEVALAMLRGAPAEDEAIPPHVKPSVKRLAIASARADVFGAMGSFNDFYLEDVALEAERTSLSGKLWDAMRSGILVAANAC